MFFVIPSRLTPCYKLVCFKSSNYLPNFFLKKVFFDQCSLQVLKPVSNRSCCTFICRVLLTYISADFRDMDEMRGSFEDDFKSYNKLMEEVAKKPIVSKCCLMPERKSMLVTFGNCF